jgi:hypothetical protein
VRYGISGSRSSTRVDQIFALVLARRTSKQIATQLGLDVAEVESVIGTAKLQLGVRSRQEAAMILCCRPGFSAGLIGSKLRTRENKTHFEPMRAAQAANLVDTKRELNSISAYVMDVGNSFSARETETGIFDQMRRLNNVFDSLSRLPVLRSILMMLLIVIVGAMALASLVTAMQGFDTLFNA